VRWGNGAADQRQHDVYGEILDCADQWVRGGGRLEPPLRAALAQLADMTGEAWRQPDQGIWEVRSEGRVFTYSAAVCQVALDRAAAIRRMKPTLILVNTARGPIVNDDALYLALKEGWIAGAGLDDIEEEPAKQRDWKPANPLFGLDNVVITPHAAYYSEEAIRTVRDFAAHEVVRVLTGQPPLSPVNAAQLAIVQLRHSP
jgi:D-isomer specific 2-hydroxyacid dehydrogenase, NAD binding domain/Glycosyl hydrolases family 15